MKSFFTNKHVITAMIVAPLLAVGAYYATDLVVKERPHVAEQGRSYKLIAKPNCRYTSGACDLVNSGFKSTLLVERVGEAQVLRLSSTHPLDSVQVGFVSEGQEFEPSQMQTVQNDAQKWSMPLVVDANKDTRVRLALMANGTSYFAETTMGFSEYKTSFGKTF